jgi:hypothetical protein
MKGTEIKPVTRSWILFNMKIVKFRYFYTGNLGREVALCDACIQMNVKDTAPLLEPDSDVQPVYS